MLIYADASALAKLVVAEAETPALREWLSARGGRLVTTSVGVVELQRLAARVSHEAELAELEVVLTYDGRITDAARGLGLPVESPGDAAR